MLYVAITIMSPKKEYMYDTRGDDYVQKETIESCTCELLCLNKSKHDITMTLKKVRGTQENLSQSFQKSHRLAMQVLRLKKYLALFQTGYQTANGHLYTYIAYMQRDQLCCP